MNMKYRAAVLAGFLVFCAYIPFTLQVYTYESRLAAKAAAVPQSAPMCQGCAYTASAPTHVHQFTQVILPTAKWTLGFPLFVVFWVGITLVQKRAKEQRELAQ